MAIAEVSQPTQSDFIHATDRGIALSGRDYVSLDLYAVPKERETQMTVIMRYPIKTKYHSNHINSSFVRRIGYKFQRNSQHDLWNTFFKI